MLPTNAEIRLRKNLMIVNFKRRLSIKGISKREITFVQRDVMAHYLQLPSKVLPYEDASGQLQWNPGGSNSEGEQKAVPVRGVWSYWGPLKYPIFQVNNFTRN